MKTPDEIKKDIIHCMDEAIVVSESGDAHDLLNFSDKAHVCMAVTLTYIQQLEANHSKVKAELKRLTQNHIEDMKIICKLERERDAAVVDISLMPCACDVCVHGITQSNDCERLNGNNWCSFEWRGICPENTEVQE